MAVEAGVFPDRLEAYRVYTNQTVTVELGEHDMVDGLQPRQRLVARPLGPGEAVENGTVVEVENYHPFTSGGPQRSWADGGSLERLAVV
jgi:hypothetical protein